MDKMREEFEKWATRYHGALNMGVVDVVYSNHAVQHDWFLWQQAWQASRQALVVELPPQPLFDGHDEYIGGILHWHAACKSEAKRELNKLGIKWTE